ncbi:DUF6343 family protein [Streptomyces sp. TLI_171]|uniref:DUF6343 family protein n=1 Tax=Streptomyces sp. TLI_171 TaxID=1938859 RepID=UPI000C19B4C3|nr:DUF6343 family protein [Streptomyces sp. TLI_171]RKE18335.1 hypothetical protein BX266_1624 [Streptomyces sp. TLI_171]
MRRARTPRIWRSGTEPATARSDLKLRFLLSVLFVPFFALGTAGFAVWSAMSSPHDVPSSGALIVFAVGCGVMTLVAAADLWVVVRRRRTEL